MVSPFLKAGFAALLMIAVPSTGLATSKPPYTIAPDLFDMTRPGHLGLELAPGTETFTIFAPDETSDKFHNGVVLIPFKGRLYAQWQASACDEDSADTWVAYSHSDDGARWSPPATLAPRGSRPGEMRSNGGWWTDGKVLIAFTNVWPTGFQSGDGGHAEYQVSSDGTHWSPPSRVMGRDGQPVEGIIEQDPHALPDGRIITAFHRRPGLIATPFYTDHPLGIAGWVAGQMENLPQDAKAEKNVSRELEPSLFLRPDGCAVMVFRDQASSFKQLAAESCDRGESWTRPVLTEMPDSRSKQSAGNLPDGTAYLVNAPSQDRVRMPLAVTLSPDGRHFTKAYRLRGVDDLQPLRFAGQYKRPGYHYPKSTLWQGYLYVGYTTNKEDVQVTRIPLSSLQ
ncbi:sialidase family protein [Niveispirillum irakense]|uniref:sialidase family protein n=1 Tax=Niveispirillum irakense TaxID=34011 RepID=UPI0003FCED15|nr:sialidase family protein [Niveispirillum irakense]